VRECESAKVRGIDVARPADAGNVLSYFLPNEKGRPGAPDLPFAKTARRERQTFSLPGSFMARGSLFPALFSARVPPGEPAPPEAV